MLDDTYMQPTIRPNGASTVHADLTISVQRSSGTWERRPSFAAERLRIDTAQGLGERIVDLWQALRTVRAGAREGEPMPLAKEQERTSYVQLCAALLKALPELEAVRELDDEGRNPITDLATAIYNALGIAEHAIDEARDDDA